MKDGRDGRRLFCASVHFFITDELLHVIAQLCLLLSHLLVAFVEGGKILDPINLHGIYQADTGFNGSQKAAT